MSLDSETHSHTGVHVRLPPLVFQRRRFRRPWNLLTALTHPAFRGTDDATSSKHSESNYFNRVSSFLSFIACPAEIFSCADYSSQEAYPWPTNGLERGSDTASSAPLRRRSGGKWSTAQLVGVQYSTTRRSWHGIHNRRRCETDGTHRLAARAQHHGPAPRRARGAQFPTTDIAAHPR